MARRNYAARGGKQNQKRNKVLLLSVAFLLIAAFAIGLYVMMKKTPTAVVEVKKVEKTQPKSVLPSRPEEVWSYIQALETRTIPVDEKAMALDKSLSLTEEQRKILQAMAAEQKKAEKIALKATALENQQKSNSTVSSAKSVAVVENKSLAMSSTKSETHLQKQYGLQCGAFKNKSQAEALQNRLVAIGLNAKVNSSDGWHRVVVGPVGSRTNTLKAQDKAKMVISCVVIGM